MQNQHKILACVDRSPFAHYVADYAAWAAQRTGAPLEFLHVIDRAHDSKGREDRSGSIGVGAQQALLDKLSDDDEQRARAAREAGRLFLNELRERAIVAGAINPDVRQRHGDLEETLAEQQGNVRFFVLGRRGEAAATTQRDLGRNVERVVRALKRPILAVNQPFKQPQSFMLAYDGGLTTRRGVEMIAASPLFKGLRCHLLMSGKARQDGPRDLEWATQALQAGGHQVHAELIPGDAETVIARQIQAQEIDLLIMGAYAHSPLRSLLLGSTTSEILRSARVPTVLLS